MFLSGSAHSLIRCKLLEVSYWSVGVMPLGPVEPATGVAAGVAGVTPAPFVA